MKVVASILDLDSEDKEYRDKIVEFCNDNKLMVIMRDGCVNVFGTPVTDESFYISIFPESYKECYEELVSNFKGFNEEY